VPDGGGPSEPESSPPPPHPASRHATTTTDATRCALFALKTPAVVRTILACFTLLSARHEDLTAVVTAPASKVRLQLGLFHPARRRDPPHPFRGFMRTPRAEIIPLIRGICRMPSYDAIWRDIGAAGNYDEFRFFTG
jgi:hypothetical protein